MARRWLVAGLAGLAIAGSGRGQIVAASSQATPMSTAASHTSADERTPDEGTTAAADAPGTTAAASAAPAAGAAPTAAPSATAVSTIATAVPPVATAGGNDAGSQAQPAEAAEQPAAAATPQPEPTVTGGHAESGSIADDENSDTTTAVVDPDTIPQAVAVRTQTTQPPANVSELHGPCVVTGLYYELQPDTTKLMAATAGDCQVMCSENVYCSHFTYWPSGMCYGFGRNATLINGTDECLQKEAFAQVTDGTCDGRLVVSGAQRCGPDYYSLYPLYNANAYTQSDGGGVDNKGKYVPAPAIEVPDSSQEFTPADQDHTPWISIIGGCLLVCASIGGAACAMGACSKSKTKKRKTSRSAKLQTEESSIRTLSRRRTDYQPLTQEDAPDDPRPPEPRREPMSAQKIQTAPAAMYQPGYAQPRYQIQMQSESMYHRPLMQTVPVVMQAQVPQPSLFDALDRNHDGVVTRAEFEQGWGSMQMQPQSTALQSIAAAPLRAIATPLQSIAAPLQSFAAAPLQTIQSWDFRPIQYVSQYYTQAQAPMPGEYIVISQQEPYADML